jgi:hypothetical protein
MGSFQILLPAGKPQIFKVCGREETFSVVKASTTGFTSICSKVADNPAAAVAVVAASGAVEVDSGRRGGSSSSCDRGDSMQMQRCIC